MMKAEVLNYFFAPVFTGNFSSYTTEVAEAKGKDRENEEPHTAEVALRPSKEPGGAQIHGT